MYFLYRDDSCFLIFTRYLAPKLFCLLCYLFEFAHISSEKMLGAHISTHYLLCSLYFLHAIFTMFSRNSAIRLFSTKVSCVLASSFFAFSSGAINPNPADNNPIKKHFFISLIVNKKTKKNSISLTVFSRSVCFLNLRIEP